jgi:hypothetical protein
VTMLDEQSSPLELLRRAPGFTSRTERDAATRATVAFLADLSEAERRRLAPQAARWHRAAQRQLGQHEAGPGEVLLDAGQTSLALFGTATLAELRADRWFSVSAAACRVLADRKPAWLADGLELLLERTTSSFAVGEVALAINDLVARGAVAAPLHDHYAIGIAFAYAFDPKKRPIVDRVRDDIDRVRHAVWRQFEVEGGGEISLSCFEKFCAPKSGGGWAPALKTLSDEDNLDRQLLLDASLDALNRGFSQFRAGWFSRFHELLAPTPDERAARVDRYLDLLSSPIGPTVSMALGALKIVQRADRLDPALVIERIAPALYVTVAATAKGALGLLERAAQSRPELAAAALRLAAAGLEHRNGEVQEAALQLIERRRAALDVEARAAIGERAGVIPATLRPRVEALLADGLPTGDKPRDRGSDIAAIEARAKRLPADLRRLSGVDAALAALGKGAPDIARAEFNGMDIARLDPAGLVAPIETFTEFVDEALVAIEHPADLDRVERVLAGAVAFAARRPADEASLIAPLAKSLKRYTGKNSGDWVTPRGTLQIVLSAFLGATPPEFTVLDGDPRAVVALRTAAMERAIREGIPSLQLSAPTHAGCWIDPMVLVDRSRRAAGSDAPTLLGVADQVMALLRLAPNREQALGAACVLGGEWGAALRYALGGEESIGATPSIWVAAARSRAPFGEHPRLAELLGESAPGLDLPPSLAYATEVEKGKWLAVGLRGNTGKIVRFGKEAFGSGRRRLTTPVQEDRCFTTRSLSDPGCLGHLDTYQPGDMAHIPSWAAALWPQHPEPLFALAGLAACMIDGNVYMRPASEPLADGLKAILDPDVPVGPMAMFMLCRGLNAIDRAAGEATVDALVAAIDDGRIDGALLGAAMHEFLMGGLVVAKRWPDRLKDIARASPLALQVVRVALERALYPGAPIRDLRDMHAWLETLLELTAEARAAVEDEETRGGLRSYLAGGKAKKAAKALLEMKPLPSQGARDATAVHAATSRIARAERWLRSSTEAPLLSEAALK